MTKHDIKKIAVLARLQISDADLEQYRSQLSSILDYFEQLNEVNTDKTPITSQLTGLANVLREDSVEECICKDELLGMAPEIENNGVHVKRVIA